MSHGILVNARVQPYQEGVRALQGLPSSVVSDVMGRMVGTTGLHPVNRSAVSVCGSAFTVRVRAGDNLLIHKALDMLKDGDVLVVDGEADVSRALVGEIMMTSARAHGAIAFVIDGAIRDAEAFEAHQFPCWARGINLRGPYKEGPGTINEAVTVGGMLVSPGDIIVGDGDGLVAVSPADALSIANKANEKVAQEKAMIAAILDGSYSSAWVDQALIRNGDGRVV